MFDHLYFTDNSFSMFSIQHFFTLLLVGSFIYRFIYTPQEKREKVHMLLFGLGIAQQLLLYSWYYANQQFNYIDALPLYPCRIMQVLNIMLLLVDSELLYEVLYLVGIPSALVALIVADTSGHGLPSAMFVQFFLGHTLMILIPIYIGKKRAYKLSSKSLPTIAKIIGVYFIIVKIINISMGSNYGYISNPPGDYVIKGFFPSIIYLFGYYLLYISAVKMWYTISKKLSIRFRKIKLVYEID